MITIKQRTMDEMVSEPNLTELLAEYAQESAIDGMPPPAAQFDQYRMIEATGALHIGAAYQGDRLVGFVTLLAPVLPHYGVMVATTESFFVERQSRKSGAGTMLRHWIEDKAVEIGAYGLLICAPIGGRLASALEKQREYRETNRVFFKRFK